jgi:hypothetical protein
MHLKKIAQPLQLFAVLPILTANFALPVQLAQVQLNKAPTAVVSVTDENGPLLIKETDNQQKLRDEKVRKIDKYFADQNLPLAGFGKKFVEEAEKNGLPWNLLAAQGMIESTGGKFAIPNTNNYFGWGGGKIKFKSVDEAIEVISRHLGGNHEATERYYKDKNLDGILASYNPPKIAPDYNRKVKKVMALIENYNITD